MSAVDEGQTDAWTEQGSVQVGRPGNAMTADDFSLLCPVDGTWSDWSDWAAGSGSRGLGAGPVLGLCLLPGGQGAGRLGGVGRPLCHQRRRAEKVHVSTSTTTCTSTSITCTFVSLSASTNSPSPSTTTYSASGVAGLAADADDAASLEGGCHLEYRDDGGPRGAALRPPAAGPTAAHRPAARRRRRGGTSCLPCAEHKGTCENREVPMVPDHQGDVSIIEEGDAIEMRLLYLKRYLSVRAQVEAQNLLPVHKLICRQPRQGHRKTSRKPGLAQESHLRCCPGPARCCRSTTRSS